MTAEEKSRIVIVGGGTGGMAVVSALCQWPGRENLDIVLVEPSEYHYYQPQWTMVGGGLFPREVTRRPMAELVPSDVTWMRKRVEGFDPRGIRVAHHNAPLGPDDASLVIIGVVGEMFLIDAQMHLHR